MTMDIFKKQPYLMEKVNTYSENIGTFSPALYVVRWCNQICIIFPISCVKGLKNFRLYKLRYTVVNSLCPRQVATFLVNNF